MECPIKTPVRVIETNGSIVDANNEMILKVLYSHKSFELQVKQLHYTAKVINSHENLVKELREARQLIHDQAFKEAEQE